MQYDISSISGASLHFLDFYDRYFNPALIHISTFGRMENKKGGLSSLGRRNTRTWITLQAYNFHITISYWTAAIQPLLSRSAIKKLVAVLLTAVQQIVHKVVVLKKREAGFHLPSGSVLWDKSHLVEVSTILDLWWEQMAQIRETWFLPISPHILLSQFWVICKA